MVITKIEVKNFKSFKEIAIKLGNPTILIGANASGKTNFTHLFLFFRELRTSNVNEAIEKVGGALFFKKLNSPEDDPVAFKVTIHKEEEVTFHQKYTIKTNEIIYSLKFNTKKGEKDYKIISEEIKQKGTIFKKISQNDKKQKGKEIGSGEIIYKRNIKNQRIKISFDLPNNITEEVLYPHTKKETIRNIILKKNEALIKDADFLTVLNMKPIKELIESQFEQIAIYDFNPHLSKEATSLTSGTTLKEDGSNLAAIVGEILNKEKKQKKFLNLIGILLPQIKNIETKKIQNKNILKMEETYSNNHILPANLLSDGTINITALITALFFEKKKIAIFEEPTKNIHPSLINNLMELIKEAAERKQIIITTHNPEVVKNVKLENLLLIARNKAGISEVVKPAEKKEVEIFLKNELGIDYLFINKMLEI